MQKLLIKGKKYLNGSIPISGSKNATLPILAASILANTTKLKNVPLVQDIFTMIELLKFIGIKIKVSTKKKTIELVNKNKRINTLAPYKLVKTMRAGILVLGPLLTKYKKAKVSLPGGCAIGTRPVDLHLLALKKLGAKIKIKNGYIHATALKGLKGTNIKFPFISVGATENAILAAFGAEGKTVLKNCAIEPEIKDLINYLNKLGGKINIKKRKITILGVRNTREISYKVMFDRIELGTYLISAGTSGNKISFSNVDKKVINTEIKILKKIGVKVISKKNKII
jgi:UDP-N-acetylglucosamine 1-carboxyvinyltransferase